MKRFIALLTLAACSMLSTRQETATRDMRLYVVIASSDAAGTHVSVTLSGPFAGEILGPEDSFTSNVSGAPLGLVSTGVDVWAVDTNARSGDFAFALHHAGDHDVTSVAPLPSPSHINGTSGGGVLSMTWTPQAIAGLTTTLAVSGECIDAQAITIENDTGTYTLHAEQLQGLPLSCPLAVTLTRTLAITTTPFDASVFMSANLTQVESMQITWIP